MKLKKITQEELNEILKQHKLWLKSNGKEGKRADLNYADLSFVDLSNENLSCAILRNTNLNYADLRNVDLSYADLTNTNLRKVNLSNADLSYANLRNANLNNVDLSYIDLRNANLSHADLSNAILENAILYNTILFCTNIDDMVSFGNVGKYHRTVYYFYKEDRVVCGCFDDTLEEFKEAVKDKYGEDYGVYKKCIKVFEMYKED